MKNLFNSVAVISVFLIAAHAGCAKKQTVAPEQMPPEQQKTAPIDSGKQEQKPGDQQAASPVVTSQPVGTAEPGSRREILRKQAEIQMIHFDYDKSDIRGQEAKILDADSRVIMEVKSVPVIIEGHCDDRGSAEYNLALGERRARSVKDYLKTMGIDESRLETISYGKEKPLVNGTTEADYAKNRRSEIKFKLEQ